MAIQNPFSGAAALSTMSQMAQYNPLANAGQRLGDISQLNARDELAGLMDANGGQANYSMAPTAMMATPQAQKLFTGQQSLGQGDRRLDMTQAQNLASNALQKRGQDMRNSLGRDKLKHSKSQTTLLEMQRATNIKKGLAEGRQQAELMDIENQNNQATTAYDAQHAGTYGMLDKYLQGTYGEGESTAASNNQGERVQAPTEQLTQPQAPAQNGLWDGASPYQEQIPSQELAAPQQSQGKNVFFPDADTFYSGGQGVRATFGAMESPVAGQNADGSYKRMDADTANRVNSQVNAFGGETLNDGLNQGVKQSAAMQILIENGRRQSRGETPWTQKEMTDMVDTVGGNDWAETPNRDQKPGSFTYTEGELAEAGFRAIDTGKIGGTESKRKVADFFLGDQRVSDQLSKIVGGVDAGGRTADQVNQALVAEKVKRLDKSSIKGAKAKGNAYKANLANAIEKDNKRDDMIFSNGGSKEQKQWYKDNPEAGKNLVNKGISTASNALAKDPSIKGKQAIRAKLKNIRDTFDEKSQNYMNADRAYKSLDPYASEATNRQYIADQFGEDFDKSDWGLFTPGKGTPQKALTDFADTFMNKIGFNVGIDNWSTLAEPKFFDALNSASLQQFGKPIDFKEIEKLTHDTGKGGNFEQEGWFVLDNQPASATKMQKLIDSAADIYQKNAQKDATGINRFENYQAGLDANSPKDPTKTAGTYGKTAVDALTEGFRTPEAVKPIIANAKARKKYATTKAEDMVERSSHTKPGLKRRVDQLDVEEQEWLDTLK